MHSLVGAGAGPSHAHSACNLGNPLAVGRGETHARSANQGSESQIVVPTWNRRCPLVSIFYVRLVPCFNPFIIHPSDVGRRRTLPARVLIWSCEIPLSDTRLCCNVENHVDLYRASLLGTDCVVTWILFVKKYNILYSLFAHFGYVHSR